MADIDRVSQADSEKEAFSQVSLHGGATCTPLKDQSDLAGGGTATEQTAEREVAELKGSQSSQPEPPLPEITCPLVNCAEKILFCFDFSKEMSETYFRSRVGTKSSAHCETIKAIRMYVMNKNQINPDHQFGLAVFQDMAFLIKGFTSKPKEFLTVLEEFNERPEPSCNFDLTGLFEMIRNEVPLPTVDGDIRIIPPPYIVRVIMIYGRSHFEPYFTNAQVHHELESSPYFFVDVLYVHEPPSEENKCEEIFTRLCDLDHKGMSYILEASNLTRLFDSMAKLLAHPLQRPVQRQADYHIATTPSGDPQASMG